MKLRLFISACISTMLFTSNIFAANPQLTFLHNYGTDSTELYYSNYTNIDNVKSKTVSNTGKHNILYIDGSIVPDIDIKIKNNRSLIPLRTVSEKLNYKVDWDSTTKTITMTNNDKTAILTIGSSELNIANQIIHLDALPEIINGLTYIPVNALKLALGVETDYYLSDMLQDNFQVAIISIEHSLPQVNYNESTAKTNLDVTVKEYLNKYLSDTEQFSNAVVNIDNIFLNLDIYLVDTIGRYYVFNLWNRNTSSSSQKVLFDMTNGNTYSVRGDGSGIWFSVSDGVDGSAYAEEIIYDNIYYPNDGYYDNEYYNDEYIDDYYSENYSDPNSLTTVYIGDTGNKYHRSGCATLKAGGTAISLDTALAQGRTACKVCKP